MLPVVERALREQRAESQLWSEWVFPNERGGHLDITNLRERVWKPTLRLAGLRARALYQPGTRLRPWRARPLPARPTSFPLTGASSAT